MMFRAKSVVQGAALSLLRRHSVWSSDRIVKSPFRDVMVLDCTVDEYVWRNLDKWPKRTATVCGLTNRQYTYEQVYKHSRNFGANLRSKLRIKDGDAVAVMLPNMPEFPTVTFGILAAGGIVTTLNPLYTAHEVKRQILMSDAKVVITHPNVVTIVKQALQLSGKRLPIIELDVTDGKSEGTISFKEFVAGNTDLDVLKDVKRTSDDVSFLPYSSGTTGLPKGVELTNRNVVANFQQQCTECRHFDYTTDSHQNASLGLLPLFHAYGLLVNVLHKMSEGVKIVTLPRFEPSSFLNSLLEYKIDLLYVVPPIVLFLTTNPQVTDKHFRHLKYIQSGAAPIPESDTYKFTEKLQPNTVFGQGYGLTETGPLITLSPLDLKKFTTVGLTLPNQKLRVVDENLNNLGPNEVGELLVKGPNVMKGYKNNPEANAEAFVEGGWFRTGDLVQVNDDGAVTVVDRIKELIKVKGFQVPPAELESVLKNHPAVFDAAVVGVTDPSTGQSPRAFVTLRQGVSATTEGIRTFVNDRVAPYKRIREVTFIDAIPKSTAGKILRKVLVERFC